MVTQPQPVNTEEVKKVIWAGVKEKARELIGQPTPPQVRRSRRGDGRRRAGVTGALDIYAPVVEEEIPDVPRMATNPALHGRAITTVKSKYLGDIRKKRHEQNTLFHFSREAIAHANFLKSTQGQTSMDHYLKQIKEGIMSHTAIAESLERMQEDRKVKGVPGGIEAQLLDAQEKAKHFREEAERLEAQADQQDKIALKLREILDIMGGSTGRKRSAGPGSSPWPARFQELLVTPMKKNELFYQIKKRWPDEAKSMYPAINQRLNNGKLLERNGMISLPPGEAAATEE